MYVNPGGNSQSVIRIGKVGLGMTGDQVLKLLESGFTAEEIRKMQEPAPEPQQDPQPEPQKEQEPEPERQQETAPEPQKDPEPSETDKRLDALETSIAKLVKTLQESNLKKASFNSDPADSLEAQTDKIMASIIRPETERK